MPNGGRDDEEHREIADLMHRDKGRVEDIERLQAKFSDLILTLSERDDTIAAMMIELGEWQTKCADLRELNAALLEVRDRMTIEGAKVVHALDCSTQLIEALLAWMPEGLVLSPAVGSAKGAWSEAMKTIRR